MASSKSQKAKILSLACFLFLNLHIAAQTPLKSFQKTRTFHSVAEFNQLTKGKIRIHRAAQLKTLADGILTGSASGIVQRESQNSFQPFPSDVRLPSDDITVIAQESSFIWIGTKRGIIQYNYLAGGKVSYYAGKRWLPDDHITGIGFEELTNTRAVWIETPKGFSRIQFKLVSLADKAKHFQERVRARHVRHGFTANSLLLTPGDVSTSKTISTDNDGLWTAMYVAAECFRWKVTGEMDARDHARQGLQALLRLEAITGIPGFPARSIIKPGEDIQPADGEWHTTPDGQWRWKDDTSSDEIVGHYFGYSVYYDLVADEAEKRQISNVVERITSHILDNNYQLMDVDGQRTRWGWWGPEEIWKDADETGLRALHLLSHLRTAIHITQDAQKRQRFQAAYDELIQKHRYHLLMRNQKIMVPGHINHSDDELAFLSYYPLLMSERDPELLAVYRESLERSWQIERPERNPLWNFIYAAGTGSAEFDRDDSIQTLQQIPTDLITWTVTNSYRNDVVIDPMADRFKRQQLLTVLPPDERPVMKWNGNPYNPDGGNGGKNEDDGAFFLLPYWMGRFHQLIDE
jgi:hypothetical protein